MNSKPQSNTIALGLKFLSHPSILNNTDFSIQTEKLTKVYGKKKAIHNLTFNIKTGEIVGFLGPNGAGKTTTMKILSGLMNATSGSAFISGISVARDPMNIKKIIGYMPENNPLPEEMRVLEYLEHRANLKNIPFKLRKNRIDEVIELCDLGRTAQRKIIATLSKGFRQRVGIADCLLAKPQVIIMDEPTIGLDPHQILSMRNLLRLLKGQITIILSSHILPEIEAVCDESIIINQGEIVAQGSSQHLRKTYFPGNKFKISASVPILQLKNTILAADPNAAFNNEFSDHKLSTLEFFSSNENLLTQSFLQPIAKQFGIHTISEAQLVTPSLEDIFIAATKPSWNFTSNLPIRRPTL